MSLHFAEALAIVLSDAIEGGYSDHPKDRGGPTNMGVSLRAVRQLDADKRLPQFLRAELDVDDDGDIDEADVPGWSRQTAEIFYDSYYWQPIRGDELPWPLSLVVFDSAVNEGVGTAIRHLQNALNGPDVDGIMGPQTLAAARGASWVPFTMRPLLRRFSVARLDRYRQLTEAPDFFRGWAGRVLDTYVESLKAVA